MNKLMMKKLFFLLIFTSCAGKGLFGWKADDGPQVSLEDYQEFSNQDYIDHLKSFEDIYKKQNTLVGLRQSSYRYLENLVRTISENNELFFEDKLKPRFYIVKSKIPFHFSLPGGRFFLSNGLLDKYIKNEAMLYCVLVYELVRSEKNIYQKQIVIPTKVLNTTRVLSLMRLNTEDKLEIHKWAFYLLKRAGINTDTYLSWLQIKNRNSIDFAKQLGDIQSISREEAMFKAFIIENNKGEVGDKYTGSSRSFYSLLNDIKG
jgi:hypothetical protein|tara:strand:+ start:1233 stop:2015 length:783 start_codon:yes stop_codon:yes gene_type:complete